MVCNVCGKEIKYPKSKSHINSRYHQLFLVRAEEKKPVQRVTEKPETSIDKPKPTAEKKKTRKIHIDKDEVLDTLGLIGTVILAMLFLMGIPVAITLGICYLEGDITSFFPFVFYIQILWIIVLYVIFSSE